MSSVSGSSSSVMNNLYGIKNNGIGGLASGLDTDDLVEKLTMGTRSKIAKNQQQKQMLQWTQKAYRNVSSTLLAFQTDRLKYNASNANDMTKRSFYNSYVGKSSSDKVSVVTSGTSRNGTITIEEIQSIAISGRMDSLRQLQCKLVGDEVDLLSQTFATKTLRLSVDGSVKTIKLDTLDSCGTIQDIENELQRLVDEAFGRRPLNNGELITASNPYNNLPSVYDPANPTISKVEIFITTQISGDQTIQIVSKNNVTEVLSQDMETVLGLSLGDVNRVSTSSTLTDILNTMTPAPSPAVTNGDVFRFRINGVDFEVTGATKLSELMSKITNSSAGAKLTFSTVTELLTLTATEMGAGNTLAIEDLEGNLLNSLFGARGGNSISNNTSLTMGYGNLVGGSFTMAQLEAILHGFEGKDIELTLTIDGVTQTIKFMASGDSHLDSLDPATLPPSAPPPYPVMEADGVTYKQNAAGTEWYYYDEPFRWNGQDAITALKDTLNTGITKTFGAGTDVKFDFSETSLGSGVFQVSLVCDPDTRVTLTSNGTTDLLAELQFLLPSQLDNLSTGTRDLMSSITSVPSGFISDLVIGGVTFAPPAITWSGTDTIQQIIHDINALTQSAFGYDLITIKNGVVTIDAQSQSLFFTESPASGGVMDTLFGTNSFTTPTATATVYDESVNPTGTIRQGTDLKVKYEGRWLTNNSNTINIDGITVDVSAVSDLDSANKPIPIVITVTNDPDILLDRLSKFVDDYNALVDYINTYFNEDKEKGYTALSDEQKQELSTAEIEKWEENAQKGILKNDQYLRRVLSDMRTSLYVEVENAGISLYDIGITTQSLLDSSKTYDFTNSGKLTIDDEKLRTAIETNPDAIYLLFADPSLDADENPQGLVYQLSRAIDAAAKVTSNDEERGYLIGMGGYDSFSKNHETYLQKRIESIDEQIEKLKTRLQTEYERYWKQFSALETALQKLSAQSSWLYDTAS